MAEEILDDEDILARLGNRNAALLGSGGEAQVYALDDRRVARIMRPGATAEDAHGRAALLQEIAAGNSTLPFATPEVLEIAVLGARVAAVERRLDGQPMSAVLPTVIGRERLQLVQAYLEAAERLHEIELSRPFFGPLLGGEDVRSKTWRGFLQQRLALSARTCPPDLRAAVLDPAICALPPSPAPRLVHLDYFPANVLVANGAVSAVLDFGPTALAGDPRLDLWSAVAYLDNAITPVADEDDRRFAAIWLEARGLLPDYAPARRWLAAYWTHAADDAQLMAWCRGCFCLARRVPDRA